MGSGSSLGPKDYEKKSSISRAKGVGSSYRGSQEWLMSRIQAVISVPFTVYVLISLLIGGSANSYFSLLDWLSNPINTTFLVIAIVTLCWHGMHGLLTVINDYVHNKGVNLFMTLSVKTFFIFIGVSSLVSIIITMV